MSTASNLTDDRSAEQGDRGRDADLPTDIPSRGWRDVLARVRLEAKDDNLGVLAGGIAFFAMLAIVPAAAAVVSIYGLISDPAEIERQVVDALDAAPTEVRELVGQQMSAISEASAGRALTAALLGLVVSFWSASGAVSNMMTALNVAYDEDETRGFTRRRGLALALTVGAIVFVIFALGLITVVPVLIGGLDLGIAGTVLAWTVRWFVLLAAMLVALAVVYRCGPDRDAPRWAWASPGAVAATVVWLAASVLFSVYVANFGSYNETYGSLAAVVILMLWLQISALVVLYGAELNAELERQTARDTTVGHPRPLGERGAYAADTVGASRDRLEDDDRDLVPQQDGDDRP